MNFRNVFDCGFLINLIEGGCNFGFLNWWFLCTWLLQQIVYFRHWNFRLNFFTWSLLHRFCDRIRSLSALICHFYRTQQLWQRMCNLIHHIWPARPLLTVIPFSPRKNLVRNINRFHIFCLLNNFVWLNIFIFKNEFLTIFQNWDSVKFKNLELVFLSLFKSGFDLMLPVFVNFSSLEFQLLFWVSFDYLLPFKKYPIR